MFSFRKNFVLFAFQKWICGFHSHTGNDTHLHKTLLTPDNDTSSSSNDEEDMDDNVSVTSGSSTFAYPEHYFDPPTQAGGVDDTDITLIHLSNLHWLNMTAQNSKLVKRLLGSKIIHTEFEQKKTGLFVAVDGLANYRLRKMVFQLLDVDLQKTYSNTPTCVKDIAEVVLSKGAAVCLTIQDKHGKVFYINVD